MSRTLLIAVLVVCQVLCGCQSPRHVPPAHGVDAGLVEERKIDRKAVLDWCDREPIARNTLYVLGIIVVGVGLAAAWWLYSLQEDS